MSKRRVSSSRRKASATSLEHKKAAKKAAAKKTRAKRAAKAAEEAQFSKPVLGQSKVYRFIGISLSGGKADKACVAVIEYYKEHNKVFLARLYEKIKTEEFISADLKIHEIVAQFGKEIESVVFDVPLTLPRCISPTSTDLEGYETSKEPEIKWLREFFAEVNKKKKPRKMFTPYTQRCVDAYLNHALGENFDIQHALGSNLAPLTARAIYVSRRLQVPCFETATKVALWRIGHELRVGKSHLRFHKHSVTGDESRRVILSQLSERKGIFIYQQDMKSMVENNHAFEAFIAAYMGFLKFNNDVEERPVGFPAEEAWALIPKNI